MVISCLTTRLIMERRGTTRAIAGVGRVLKMVKTVYNATFPIEIARDHIEEFAVVFLEFPPHRIRDKISVLYDACCSGIYKQRNISQVACKTLGMSDFLEFRSESL